MAVVEPTETCHHGSDLCQVVGDRMGEGLNPSGIKLGIQHDGSFLTFPPNTQGYLHQLPVFFHTSPHPTLCPMSPFSQRGAGVAKR